VDADIIAVILCLFGSAFFSGSETALTSLPVTRLEALRERSGRLTRAGLDRWADAPQDFLITILVGNNLVNVLASALATSIAYRVSENGGLLDLVLTPINRVLGLLARVLSHGEGPELPVTEKDLLFMLRLAHRHAHLPRDSRWMIESVLRFQYAVAREVMVPRPMVATVDSSWELETLQDFITTTPHSRFPVVEGSPDDIVGVLHAKHLLRLRPDQSWLDLVVSAVFVPESRALPDLLQDFRRTGKHLALVLDEFGGLSGIVTLEDVLELVVGDIQDEFDIAGESVIEATDNGWRVAGHLSLRRLESILHRNIEQPEDIDSVGGLVTDLLEDEATIGSTVEWDGLRLEVEEVEDGRATRVLVTRVPAEA